MLPISFFELNLPEIFAVAKQLSMNVAISDGYDLRLPESVNRTVAMSYWAQIMSLIDKYLTWRADGVNLPINL